MNARQLHGKQGAAPAMQAVRAIENDSSDL